MTNKIKIIITALAGMLVITSCYKKDESITLLQPESGLAKAYLKFINVYTASNPSTTTPTPNGPAVNIFVNNVKINAAAIGYAGLFPASTVPGYSAVDPALGINIKIILNRASGGPLPGDTLSNKNYDLGINSYTSFYLTDTTPNVTPFNPFVLPIQELVTNAPIGSFRARFVNMIPSADTLEVFSKRLNAVIFKGQLYKNATDVVELQTFTISDTLQLRKVSAPATVLASINGFVPTSARVYTVYCTGNITASPRARALTFFTNR
jgi:hypothetical protein